MAENLQTLLIKLEANTEQMTRAMRQAGIKTDRFAKNTKRSLGGIQKSFKNLGTAAKGFAGIFAASLAARGIRNIISMADSMGMLEDRIKSATRETGGFQKVFDGLLATSLKTGTSLDASVSLFQRLAFTQKELGATNDEMVRLNDIIAKLGVISGSTMEQLKNGTLQLSQGLGEGIFRAQEFNSVLENMPAVLNAIARSMGITVAEMRKLVKEGKLLSRDVFDAILEQGDRVEVEFKEIPPRVARAWAKMSTAITASISEINKELDITSRLARVLEGFAVLFTPDNEDIDKTTKALNDLNDELTNVINKINVIKILSPFAGFEGQLVRLEAQLERVNIKRDEFFAKEERKRNIPETKVIGRRKLEPDFKPDISLFPRAVSESIQPAFGIDTEFLRELRDNAEETKQILDDLGIDILRASGKVTDVIRAEADAEIAAFKERVAAGKSTITDLANFRILKEREVSAELQKIAEQDMKRMNKAAEDFANSMAAAFESRGIEAILNGDLSGAIKGLIRDFAAMALRLAILRPLAESLFSSTGGNIFGSIIKSVLGKAGGGKVQAGVPIEVNERGKELFIPDTTGRIVNAADSRNMGRGQVTVNQTVNVTVDHRNSVRAEIFQLFPILEQQILNSVNQQFAGVRA